MAGSLLATLSILLAAAVASAPSYHAPPQGASSCWDLKKLTTLVAFGDSYTDDSRLNYFSSHNGSAPPVGWTDEANYASASGGRPWPQYVKQYAGVNLYNYAVSGAVCSNNVTPRTFTTYDFPAVEQYEVPAYIADSKHIESNGTKFLTEPQDETVYSIWIGTNDLGVNAFLTDSQVRGIDIVNYTDCVYNQLKRVYDNGGRYFVLQNVAPLNLAPLYALPSQGGVVSDNYWPEKPSNITEISYRMMEQVALVNNIYKYQTPYLVELSKNFTGAKFAVMDMHGLITDIYNNPTEYLNGTAPLQVDVAAKHCNSTGTDCVVAESLDSYLWYDDLHPSEQTDRIIAREFLGVVKGESRWATYWG
ncbi:carbohydrate esterase family 16 protein [Dothistroma septosporum NZE10]|uniref:Carbohydrate esterase family 16 protein n=1 Tax=Dothistroma septosporum (strain NZE10 / CBS 128990) TaxID=675120 RepID=N1PDB0_DOTSN|nr:carbohydrate esterase family 16 protein [Dothistroma septosporum NZE10]